VVTLYASTTTTQTVNVHRATAPWSEGTVSWQSFAGAFDPTVAASFSSGPAQAWQNVGQAVPLPVSFHLESLVQAWLDGTSPNDGILLEQTPNLTDNTVYRTGEWSTASQRPRLDVCWAACTGGQACDTGLHGVCASGTTACVNGAAVCQQNMQPSPETCDGLDNDCNGQIDDGNPDGGQACQTGLPGACSAGTTACVAGQIQCQADVQPSPEVCDGIDNDCNGVVDDGCNCIDGQTQACYGGPAGTQGVSVCQAGTQTCVNGNWGPCQGDEEPSAETCDGLDNDCNGQVDDGAAASCPTPANGTAACTGGACGLGACNAGFGNCDGIASNGCETNTHTDSNNCGSCGHACTGGATCVNGSCQAACLSASPDPVTGQKCPIKEPCTQYADCGTQVTGRYWYCSPTTHVCEFLPQTGAFTAASGSCTGNLLFRQDSGAPWDKKILPPDGVSFREGTTLALEVTNTTASDLYLDQIPLTLELGGTNPSQFDVTSIKMYEIGSITDYGDGNNGTMLVCSSPQTPFGASLNFTLGTGATGGCGGSSFSRIPHGGTTRFIIDLAFAATETYITNRQYRLRLTSTTGVKARVGSTVATATSETACTEPTVPVSGSWLIFKTQ
jgi:hypothetical protein